NRMECYHCNPLVGTFCTVDRPQINGGPLRRDADVVGDFGNLGLRFHHHGLSGIDAVLQGANYHERETESEGTDYRIAMSNGIMTLVIWIAFMIAGCRLC